MAASANQILGGSINFGLQLSSAPTVQIIPGSGPVTSQCPGSVAAPSAALGYLCIYETSRINVSGFFVCEAPDCNLDPGANSFGALVYLHSTAAGRFFTFGSWAVTGA